MQNIYLLS